MYFNFPVHKNEKNRYIKQCNSRKFAILLRDKAKILFSKNNKDLKMYQSKKKIANTFI